MDESQRPKFLKGGFQGFPKQLPDNTTNYVLAVINDNLETRKLLTELEHIRKLASELCERLTKEYIWQRDGFQLQVMHNNGLHYLQGTTNYGDSVEDEWLIVFLLRELTRLRSDLWARVTDGDGEFLLIEAANAVPKWLNPEVDSNRAWINQGQLKLITLDASQAQKRPLSLDEAVHALQTNTRSVEHYAEVENEAFYRLNRYPQQITDSLHFSILTIPRKLAVLIHSRPSIIAPAIEAFGTRNPVSLEPLHQHSAQTRFPPDDLVSVSIKFTKVLFAQLKSQQCTPFLSWADVLQAVRDKASEDDTAKKDFERMEAGMKLTSGFEYLATSADASNSRLVREFAILLDDLEVDIQQDGAEALPTSEVIQSWPHAGRDDDELWLDINFEDFENELEGRKKASKADDTGFGSAAAHADLQKIVSRFESFLNDESAGVDGAQLEDMDKDDDVSDDQETDSEDEDAEVTFDEALFASMMKEMMGISEFSGSKDSPASRGHFKSGRISDVDDDDSKEIQELSAQMRAELNEHGALKLGGKSQSQKTLKGGQSIVQEQDEVSEESDDDGVDVDYNLAKNLLESFKSQAGLAGPAGNILGLMGMQLPRDEQNNDPKARVQ